MILINEIYIYPLTFDLFLYFPSQWWNCDLEFTFKMGNSGKHTLSLNHKGKHSALFGKHFCFWTEAFNKLEGAYSISLKNRLLVDEVLLTSKYYEHI